MSGISGKLLSPGDQASVPCRYEIAETSARQLPNRVHPLTTRTDCASLPSESRGTFYPLQAPWWTETLKYRDCFDSCCNKMCVSRRRADFTGQTPGPMPPRVQNHKTHFEAIHDAGLSCAPSPINGTSGEVGQVDTYMGKHRRHRFDFELVCSMTAIYNQVCSGHEARRL